MGFLTTTIEGTEYGAEDTRSTRDARPYGEGLFARRADGTWQQQLGHSQTPGFRSEAQFRRWVLRYTLDARRDARADREPLSAEAAAIADEMDRAALERDIRAGVTE